MIAGEIKRDEPDHGPALSFNPVKQLHRDEIVSY